MKAWLGKPSACFAGIQVIRFVLISVLACSLLMLDLFSGLVAPTSLSVNGWIGLVVLPGLAYGLSFACFSLILPRSVCRIFFPIIFGWVLLFSVVNIVARTLFGALVGDGTVMILAGSSWEEIKEFFRMFAQPQWIAGILVFLLLGAFIVVGLARCAYFDSLRWSKRLFCLFLLGHLPLVVWLLICPARGLTLVKWVKNSTILRFDSFSFWMSASDGFSTLKDMKKASDNPCLPPRLDCMTNRDSSLLAVVVIGESATRSRWSLCGYERKTNPYLDSRKDLLCVFSDLVAPNHTTTGSLRYILSAATKEDKSCRYMLPSVCKRAGYDCTLLSNQVHWGDNDGAEIVFFKDCSKKFWLKDIMGDGTQEAPRYDGFLLPYIQREVASARGNKVLFVHLIGSHYPYERRCPIEFATFGLDASGKMKSDITLSDQYDNSIVYTDYILDEILKYLETRGGDSFLLYLSDHGESPRAQCWRFVKDPDTWEVPMVAWFSEGYRVHYPDVVESMYKARAKPLVSDQLLFGVTRLLRIEGVPGYTEKADFLSDAFVPREKRYDPRVDLEAPR